MQLQYTTTQPRRIHGEIGTMRPIVKRARTWPKKQHTVVVTVGGNTDGDYTIKVASADLPTAIESTIAAASDSIDDIVTALTNAVNQAATTPNLRGKITAVADLTANTVTLIAARSARPFTVTFPDNPGTNLTQSTTVDADVTHLPLGIAMVDAGRNAEGTELADLCSSTTIERKVLGVLVRSPGMYAPLDGSTELLADGSTLEIVEDGDLAIMPESDVAVGDPVHIRITSDGATEQLGAIMGAGSGSAHTFTGTPVATNLATWGFSFDYDGTHYDAVGSGDGSTTVAQEVDALVASLGTIPGLTITDAETHIQVAAAAGTKITNLRESVQYADAPDGTVTLAVTVAADVETIEMTRWKWLDAGGPTSGQPALLRVTP